MLALRTEVPLEKHSSEEQFSRCCFAESASGLRNQHKLAPKKLKERNINQPYSKGPRVQNPVQRGFKEIRKESEGTLEAGMGCLNS